MKRHYHVIGACSGWGAQIRACELGPEELVKQNVFKRLNVPNVELLYPEKQAKDGQIPLSQSLPLIHDFNLQLTQRVQNALCKGQFPIVVGGDHSIAVGTWNAFSSPFGLLWIDAHLDAHTEKTTPSGAHHGMPLAALLGLGLPEMARLIRDKPVLEPRNVAFIGIRSFEKEEIDLLHRLHVKVYFMEEVRQRGFQTVLAEAIEHVTKHTGKYGVSLDLDVFSPEEAPGVGSPEANGLRFDDVRALSVLGKDPKLIGFELVEFNPERDVGGKTGELAFAVLKEVMQ